MSPIQTVGQVFEAVQKAKAGATDYCTNFFPVESKLQGWIDHGELGAELHNGAAFFFRNNRDFQHFYFCASDKTTLQHQIGASPVMKTERIITDLVGNESALNGLLPALEPAGFRRYAQLQRMARIGQPESVIGDSQIRFAEMAECQAVLGLLEGSFDRYGEQIPMLYEIESAVKNRQILVARRDGALAGLLFFESQGFASTVRFWTVAEPFRALKVGSALMHCYLKAQKTARRFTLWVSASNENAIEKYRHYGYAPDGLLDCVLANEMIRS